MPLLRIAALAAAATALLATAGCQLPGTPTSSPSPAATSPSAAPTVVATSQAGAVADSSTEFCSQAATAGTGLFDPDGEGPDQSALLDYLRRATATAPAAIRPDLQAVLDIEEPILQGRVTSPAEIEKRLADPGLQTAARHIAGYVQSHCAGVQGGPR